MTVSSEKKKNDVLSNFLTAAKAGVKKAGEAVYAMSASAIRIDVISAGIAPTTRLSEIAGSPEDLVAGVYIKVSGEMPGHALLIFPYDSALLLVDLIVGRKLGTTKHLDELDESVIHEVSNIVTSSYLNAISDFYQCTLIPTPPCLAIDMCSAVIDSVLLNTGHFEKDTISIVTRFAGSSQAVRGFFLYISETTTPA